MTGIIDVGGGLRGIFGAGVFDRCLDDNLYFDKVYGVSAGAANAATFIGKQRGRTLRFYSDYTFRPEYMGVKNLINSGSYVSLDYIYATLSNSDGEDPLNFINLKNFEGTFTTVATNALTGKAEYFGKEAYKSDDYTVLMASSCLPVICKPIKIEGIPYYDGGASDPVPIEKAVSDGCDKIVLILTRPKNELHLPSVDKKAAFLLRNKYPLTSKALEERYKLYNESVQKALELEKQGKVLIISPSSSKGMGTLTKDKEKLTALYNEGYEKAKHIKDFIAE